MVCRTRCDFGPLFSAKPRHNPAIIATRPTGRNLASGDRGNGNQHSRIQSQASVTLSVTLSFRIELPNKTGCTPETAAPESITKIWCQN